MTTPKKAKPLLIEAGKRYRRRDGRVTDQIVASHADQRGWYPYNDGVFAWTASGHWHADEAPHPFDLLSEAPAPTPPSKPKPAARKLSGKAWAVVGDTVLGGFETWRTRRSARESAVFGGRVIRVNWSEA